MSPDACRLSEREAARLARTARPSAPPIMNAVLTTPEASPDSSGATSLMAASNIGLKAMPAPKPSTIMLGSTSTTNVPVHGGPREEHEADRSEREPGRERQPDSEAQHELGRETDRERSHDQVGREERKSDLERAVSEHELQVEGRQEEPREHRSGPEHADDVRGRDVAQPEEAERHERRMDPRLDHEEGDEQRSRGGKEAERLRGRPPGVVAVDDRVDGKHQRGGDGDGPADVETLIRGSATGRREQPQRADVRPRRRSGR